MSTKQKIGLFGLGHLGRIHLKCILESDKLELAGAYDPDSDAVDKARESYEFELFNSEEELIAACDILDIVVPTSYHYPVAKKCLSQGKHLFIEKPICNTSAEARELLELAEANSCKVQIGHVERFNPAFLALDKFNLDPLFIEGHRLAMFNPRGTDVSVVYDLMIHDLDLVLSLIDSAVTNVYASGVSIVSTTADICNARIEFENGAVANLTASRMSLKNMRKLRVFQNDAYISMDFLEKSSEIIQLKDETEINKEDLDGLLRLELPKGVKYLNIESPEIQPVNAIKMELESLANAIDQNSNIVVTIKDGLEALELAERISNEMEISAKRLKKN